MSPRTSKISKTLPPGRQCKNVTPPHGFHPWSSVQLPSYIARGFNQDGTLLLERFRDPCLWGRFGVTKFCRAIAKGGADSSATGVNDFAQRTPSVVTASKVVDGSNTTDLLEEARHIIESRYNISVWDNVEDPRIQCLQGYRGRKRIAGDLCVGTTQSYRCNARLGTGNHGETSTQGMASDLDMWVNFGIL